MLLVDFDREQRACQKGINRRLKDVSPDDPVDVLQLLLSLRQVIGSTGASTKALNEIPGTESRPSVGRSGAYNNADKRTGPAKRWGRRLAGRLFTQCCASAAHVSGGGGLGSPREPKFITYRNRIEHHMARSKSLTATVVPVRLPSGNMSSAVRYLNIVPREGARPAAGPATIQADSAESASAALGLRRAAPVVAQKPLQEQLHEALHLSEEDFGAKFFIGDQNVVTATSAVMHVRGGGIGVSAWLAKIVGTDPSYGIDREFVDAERSLSRSGRSGSISWTLDGDGIYEYWGWAESSRRSTSGFFAVLNGRVASLGDRKAGVAKAAAILDKGASL